MINRSQLNADSDITDSIGAFSGDLTINNLDVTTQGGAGNGANDIDDIIFVNIDVYNPGNGSFAGKSDLNTLNIDLGTISMGSGDFTQSFSFFNIAAGGSFGAPIDIELISSVGDTGSVTTDFAETNSVDASGSIDFDAILDDLSEGSFTATYTFRVHNERALFDGATNVEDMTLVLTGIVGEGGDCVADLAEPFGELDFFDVAEFLDLFIANDLQADVNDDGSLDFFDISDFLDSYNSGCP